MTMMNPISMKTVLGTAITLAALLPSMMNAQIDRSRPPAPGPAPAVNIGRHSAFKMDNGLQVIVVENHKLPMVGIQFKFDIVPFSQGELAGYTDLAAELIGTTTNRREKKQLDEEVDRIGANFSASKDGIYMSGLKRHFEPMMDLVYDITTSSTFPVEEFEKAKKRMLSELKQRAEDPDATADVVSKALTFGRNSPYGEVPTEETVGRVQRKHVAAYYKRFFRPQIGYLVFVGDVTLAEARKMASHYFGQWQGAQDITWEETPEGEKVQDLGLLRRTDKVRGAGGPRRVAIVDRQGAAQSVIRVTWPVDLQLSDPLSINAQVLNTIVGGGVFNARLMQNLREDKGFTYGAYSSLTPDRYMGSFSAGASVRTAVTDSAITEIMFELDHIGLKEVSAQELTLAKNYLAGQFARSLEDPRTVARFALNTYLNKLPRDHYETYLKRLDTVSAEGIMLAAKTFLKPDNASILVVGDKMQVGNSIQKLAFDGRLTQLDTDGNIYRENVRPAPAGVTAEAVLDAYLAACGGRERIMGIKDMRMEMTTEMQGMPIQVTQWYAKPGYSAMVMEANGKELQREVYNGERGVRSAMGTTEEVVEMELEDMAANAHPFPETGYKERGRLVLAGISEINGQDAYKLLLMLDNGNMLTEYYDVRTGFKVRREEQKSTGMGNITVTTGYLDYRPEDGVQFPHLMEQNAGVNLTLAVRKVELNKGVDRAVFEIKKR